MCFIDVYINIYPLEYWGWRSTHTHTPHSTTHTHRYILSIYVRILGVREPADHFSHTDTETHRHTLKVLVYNLMFPKLVFNNLYTHCNMHVDMCACATVFISVCDANKPVSFRNKGIWLYS